MNTGHPQRMNGTRPPTPRWLSLIPASIPRVLRERQRWMAWRPKPEPKSDGTWKWGKVPHNIRTGRPDDHTNPATWVAFDVAVPSLRLYTGIGYVLVDEDRIVGLDLDECRNPASGVIDESARALIRRVDSYTEISPSGHGIRIFAFGRLPPHGRKKGKLEMYTDRLSDGDRTSRTRHGGRGNES